MIQKNHATELPFKVPRSLSHVVAEHLEKEIIAGRLAAGRRLIPDELAKDYSLSKSPVREALLSLEKEGLVINVPRTGFFVADISLDDIEEIYPIRASLNALMIRMIIEKGNSALFEKAFGKIMHKMAPAVTAGDIDLFFYLNVQIWDLVLNTCPNERLKQMVQQLGKQVLRFRHLSMTPPGRLQSSYDSHRKLFKAVQDRHVETATLVAADIVYGALQALRQLLRSNSLTAT